MKLWQIVFALTALGLFGSTVAAQSAAITNARIIPVAGPAIEKGTIVIRDGVIAEVGSAVKVPADIQAIDGTGLTVYPGLIDPYTSLGLVVPSRSAGPMAPGAVPPVDSSNSNYPAGLRPEDRTEELLKGGEAQFEAHRNAGFTTVLTVGRTGIFNGRSAIIDLAGDSISAMVVRSPFAEHISFNTIQGQYPGSLLGTFSALRQMFLDAKRLERAQSEYAKDPRGLPRPAADRSLEALFPVIRKEMPVVFSANREIEIIRALDLAKEMEINAIIAGGMEAGRVADRLKRQNVPVLLSLNLPKRTASASPDADPESLEVLRMRAYAPKNAAALAAAGVRFAFQTDGMPNPAEFTVNAAKAVENGLNADTAIRAMTSDAAALLGIADRTGTIEQGKAANLTVTRGDLLAKDRVIRYVLIGGKVFEQKDRPAPMTGTRPTTAPTAATAQVGGNYSITIDIPGQPTDGTLALTQQGNLVTGTIQTIAGTSQIKDGKVTAEGFSFSAIVDYGGTSFEIFVKGSVAGTKVSGSMDSPQGSVTFTGTRNP